MQFWWLKADNVLKAGGNGGAVTLGEVLPALVSTGEFRWPCPDKDRVRFARMRVGDLGILWTDHSSFGSPDWGIIAVVCIAEDGLGRQDVPIRNVLLLNPPITPYPHRLNRPVVLKTRRRR